MTTSTRSRARRLTAAIAAMSAVAVGVSACSSSSSGKTINQIHRYLLELVPGGAAKFLSAAAATRYNC